MVFYEQEQMQYFVFRFSSGAAERHIPKCADILSNKNKPIIKYANGHFDNKINK